MYNNNCNHYYYILLRLISRPLADRTHRELLGILYIFLSSVYKREKLFLLVFRHRSWLKSGLVVSCLLCDVQFNVQSQRIATNNEMGGKHSSFNIQSVI